MSETRHDGTADLPPGTAIEDWAARPWVLGALGVAAGLLIHLVFEEDDAWRVALSAFVFFGAIWAAFTVEPRKWLEPVLFAAGAGLVMGGLAWQAIAYEEAMAGEEFAFAAGVFATIIALPLYQAGFHRTRFATDYTTTHFHVWTDAVSGAGAIAFTGLSWVMLALLGALLDLVGIDLFDLMEEGAFILMWTGGAFGTALGVLRNNLRIIGSLQSVVLIVLSLLAVPLAVALVVFLVALTASGGQALWDATDSATPILLACAVGCFVLANAVIRQDDSARSGNIVMRVASLVLALGILPLALFAAVSMGIRIDQYGLSPERIWSLVTIIVATAYGLAYWVALLRGRKAGWTGYLRQANLHLAAATSVVALFLALPILDFGAISARNQVARLESGTVSPEEFDFAALRWDFGEAGREMLDRLAAGDGEIAELAAKAREENERPDPWIREMRREGTDFHVVSTDPGFQALAQGFVEERPWACQNYCVVLDLGQAANGARAIEVVQRYSHQGFLIDPTGDCVGENCPSGLAIEAGRRTEMPELGPESVVEVRTVERRVIFVDGVPMPQPLEDDVPVPGNAEGFVGNERYVTPGPE